MHLLLVVLLVCQTLLARSDCPDGWSSFFSTDICVKAFSERKSFIEALEFCQSSGSGGTLVSIHNAFQNAQVASVGQDADGECDYWLGLYNFETGDSYKWTDGSAVDYQNWSPAYPPEATEGTVAFMALNDRNRWMTTMEISEKSCFVCQRKLVEETTTTTAVPTTTRQIACRDGWHPFGDACYYFNESYVAQADAFLYCNAQDSKMVSIHSQEEQDFITNASQTALVWIGLMKNSHWIWIDGTDFDWPNWGDNEPDGCCGSHMWCAVTNYPVPGKWADMGCEGDASFICKYKPE